MRLGKFILNYRIIIILESTMKIPNNGTDFRNKNKGRKRKQIVKKPHSALLDQQINSDDLASDIDIDKHQQNNNHMSNGHHQDLRTPEQVKIDIAKKLIQKVKSGIDRKKKQAQHIQTRQRDQGRKDGRKNQDDFFIVQDNQDNEMNKKMAKEQGKRTQIQDELGQQLKNEYLKSKNKLYTDQYSHFKNITISQSIPYKGHTKCITAVRSTADKIFSVSKDRSIIIWDRETQSKDFITMAKQQTSDTDHNGAILCMDYHKLHQMIATAGDDGKIKLWDVRTKAIISTMKGHRNTVNGIKFGFNSNNLCTVSADRTMKQWDCAQRGIIQTYYGHNSEVLDIDCINDNDFVSSGNDRQNIIWRTQKQTQMIFEGHDYAIDRVRSINQDKFVSASQDGNLNLWSTKKKKPIYKNPHSHDSWIVSLDCIKQSNILASGGCQGVAKIWAIGQQQRSLQKMHQIKTKGIVADLQVNQKQLIAVSSDQHRLGRWITCRVRNQIEVFKFSYQP